MRFFGFLFIVLGFIVLVAGVAQGAHVLTPTPWPDRTLEVLGIAILSGGIGLTAVAGRVGSSSTMTKSAASPATPKVPAAIKITTSKTFRVNLGKTTVGGTPLGADAGSTDIVKAVLAQLDDPAQAARIQIQGGDPAQFKEQLRRILSLPAQTETNAATPSIDVRAQRLRELDDLHASGVVDEEQYQAIRANLLGPT